MGIFCSAPSMASCPLLRRISSSRSRSASLDQRLTVMSTGVDWACVVMLLMSTANAVNFCGPDTLGCAARETDVMAASPAAASPLNISDLRLMEEVVQVVRQPDP